MTTKELSELLSGTPANEIVEALTSTGQHHEVLEIFAKKAQEEPDFETAPSALFAGCVLGPERDNARPIFYQGQDFERVCRALNFGYSRV